MDEPYLVERIKERVCFVSQDLQADLAAAARGRRSTLRQEYVLPDGLNSTWGALREPGAAPPVQEAGCVPCAAWMACVLTRIPCNRGPREQVLVINNERFLVPELLFSPSDIGLNQAGLAETIAASIASVPEQVQGLLWSNIVLTGGSTLFPGFVSRLERELRPLAPCEYDVHVTLPEVGNGVALLCVTCTLCCPPQDPVAYAWRGGSAFAARRHEFANIAMTKAQYEEEGLRHE